VRRFQIHKGYAARLTPRLTQKSTAQPLTFLLHGYGLVVFDAFGEHSYSFNGWIRRRQELWRDDPGLIHLNPV
jgi:hypothetical protein